MGRPKSNFKFKFPQNLKYLKEVRTVVGAIIDQIADERDIIAADIPHFHRMATIYDRYLDAEDIIAREGSTMINNKGEVVKHPAVNISRESWGVFVHLTREYALTPKSKAQMTAHKPAERDSDDQLALFEKGE